MLNLTPIARQLFRRRIAALRRQEGQLESIQRRQLEELLRRASSTEIGRRFGFASVQDYEHYCQRVAVTPYEELRPTVMRMIAGEPDILWPGVTRRFAQSSGTSDGKSKYIPITDDSLRLSHYRGGSDSVAWYLDLYPESRMFAGRGFILGGSFANELDLEAHPKVRVGDLSATLIDRINPIVNLVRVPDKQTALMADWHEKLPRLVDAAMRADVTNISGVPSWMLTVLQTMLEKTGAANIHEIWPNLEVFFHGGIAFGPYREQYNAIIDPARMHYLETYNASEGFFAVQDRPEPGPMRLIIDGGTLYEFVPVDRPDSAPLPAWKVEKGRIYAMVLTSCNGLWRYPIGDTVRIENLDPLRITITGRTKSFINAFGEEVMVYNADAAILEACRRTGASVANYTAAPVFAEGGRRGRHQWLIEFNAEPRSLEEFARRLDVALQAENSDYQAKRSGGIFLDPPTVVKARQGLFDSWLQSTGKLGGQRKVPRLSNDRRLMDAMLRFNS